MGAQSVDRSCPAGFRRRESALQDGRLMADPDTKKVYVTQPDGKSSTPQPAQPLPAAG